MSIDFRKLSTKLLFRIVFALLLQQLRREGWREMKLPFFIGWKINNLNKCLGYSAAILCHRHDDSWEVVTLIFNKSLEILLVPYVPDEDCVLPWPGGKDVWIIRDELYALNTSRVTPERYEAQYQSMWLNNLFCLFGAKLAAPMWYDLLKVWEKI